MKLTETDDFLLNDKIDNSLQKYSKIASTQPQWLSCEVNLHLSL